MKDRPQTIIAIGILRSGIDPKTLIASMVVRMIADTLKPIKENPRAVLYSAEHWRDEITTMGEDVLSIWSMD